MGVTRVCQGARKKKWLHIVDLVCLYMDGVYLYFVYILRNDDDDKREIQ